MTVQQKLEEIKRDLYMMTADRNTLIQGLNIKLSRIKDNYTRAIEANCNYILSRSNHKAMKALARYEKKKEINADNGMETN